MGVLGALATAGTAPAEAPTATFVFEGLRAPAGVVEVALFDAEAAYARRKAPVRSVRAPVSGRSVEVRFDGIAPGRYGAMAYHDVNGDGRLNTNPVGMPTEPYAFSNNARGRFGPAPWTAASFRTGPGETRQVITLR